MTSQPTPTITGADVERIVRRDFSADQVPGVLALLEEFGKEDWHREIHRVRVAVLKLAAGNLKHLQSQIKNACCDFRDVLAAAEYPGYFQRVPGPGQLSAQEEQRIIASDWQQYLDWFTRQE